MTKEGDKYDEDKPRFDLIHPDWLESIAKVLTHGANKYSANNWIDVPEAEIRYLAAAMRHINAFHKGEVFDDESGLPHLSHAACCLMFLHYFTHESK